MRYNSKTAPFEMEDMLPAKAPSFSVSEQFRLRGDGLPVKFADIAVYRSAAARRLSQWQEGKSLQPVDRMPRFVIPKASCPYADPVLFAEISRRLKKLDREFEIIYDPTTAKHGRPAHHLYRVIRGGYLGLSDWLIYEMSCQSPMDVAWNSETCVPLKPSLSWVGRVAACMKTAKYAGDAAAIHRQLLSDRLRYQWEPTERQAKEAAESSNHMYREVWHKLGKSMDKRTKKQARENWWKSNREPTVKVRVGGR